MKAFVIYAPRIEETREGVGVLFPAQAVYSVSGTPNARRLLEYPCKVSGYKIMTFNNPSEAVRALSWAREHWDPRLSLYTFDGSRVDKMQECALELALYGDCKEAG